jgi:hypothetical protein
MPWGQKAEKGKGTMYNLPVAYFLQLDHLLKFP